MADTRCNTSFSALNIPFGSEQKQKFQIIQSPPGILQAKQNYNLTPDNFSLSSQQLVPNYILYPCKCPDVHLWGILAQFWPNEHFSQPVAIFVVWMVINLLILQNYPKGGYDEKSWEMACNWLMITSSGDNIWPSGSSGQVTNKT